jgi:two-component system, OmpR family, response regulator VicR
MATDSGPFPARRGRIFPRARADLQLTVAVADDFEKFSSNPADRGGRQMKARILIVENDAALSRMLAENLVSEGFEVRCVADGNIAVSKVNELAPDLILLDVTQPRRSGFEICAVLRSRRQTPIIMLSGRADKRDKLKGLSAGADDYITKPFDVQELVARVRAVLRRSRPAPERLTLGRITIDLRMLQGWDGSDRLELSHREFELLKYLAERAHRVVSRTELLREVWGYPEAPNTRSVDHAIARLRRKIEPDVHHPRFIHTAHGDGYCLTPE